MKQYYSTNKYTENIVAAAVAINIESEIHNITLNFSTAICVPQQPLISHFTCIILCIYILHSNGSTLNRPSCTTHVSVLCKWCSSEQQGTILSNDLATTVCLKKR